MDDRNADTMLVFVEKNAIMYSESVDDPLYAAHQVLEGTGDSVEKPPVYTPDSPSSVIGCKLQVNEIHLFSTLCIADSDSINSASLERERRTRAPTSQAYQPDH
jgi:hypothetical protein